VPSCLLLTLTISSFTPSDAVYDHGVGHQNPVPSNRQNMHNPSQLRQRGFNVGNNAFDIMPDEEELYNKQPGSPYARNPAGRFNGQPVQTIEQLREKAEAAARGEYTSDDPNKIIRGFDKSDNSRPDRLGPV